MYRALNHKELLIRFQFGLDFYMTLNMIIGVLSVFLCSIFLCHHRIWNKTTPKPRMKLWSFLRMMIPAPVEGMTYALTPILAVLGVVSATIMG